MKHKIWLDIHFRHICQWEFLNAPIENMHVMDQNNIGFIGCLWDM
jgi:hypothetical protein